MVNHIYNKDQEKVTVLLTRPVGRVFTFTRENCPEHMNFDLLLVQLSKEMTDEDFIPFLNEIESFLKHGKGKVVYKEESDSLLLNGVELPSSLKKRYATMIFAGQDVTPLENFIKNLQANEYKDIREELFSFMEANELPITEDGCFLAYKTVRDTYYDKHSNTIDNSIGQKPYMDPAAVDKDRNNTCSTGFHFTSRSYATGFFYNKGDRIMVVKVNPKDVMAIPPDYNDQKGRCNTYEVVTDLDFKNEDLKKNFVKDDEKISEKLESSEENESSKAVKKKVESSSRSSVDFLLYDQASLEERKWLSSGSEYSGYKLVDVPAGENWKDCLEDEKQRNPELKSFFELSVMNGIKPNREFSNVDRVIVAVVMQKTKKQTLSEVLKKAKILLPMASVLK